MAIKTFGGGGGGGAAVISPHTVDGDTVAHWPLDGDGIEAVAGSMSMTTGLYLPMAVAPGTSGLAADNATILYGNTYSAVVDHTTWGSLNQTIAMCVWLEDNDSTQADLLRFETYSGGNAKWRIRGLNGAGAGCQPGVSLDTVAGFVTYNATTLHIPHKTWTWVAVTWNTDGKSGVIRVGADEEAWSLANPTNVGGGGQDMVPLDAWNTVPAKGGIYSIIMKDITCSTAQLNAMQAETGLV